MLKNSEEANMEYYHYLDKEKDKIFQLTKDIYEYNGSNKPLRFKVIESDMDMKTKAIALENIDKMSEMDVSTGEHSKWIIGLTVLCVFHLVNIIIFLLIQIVIFQKKENL